MSDMGSKILAHVARSFLDLLNLNDHVNKSKFDAFIQTHNATHTFLNDAECLLLFGRLIRGENSGTDASVKDSLELSNTISTTINVDVLDVFVLKTNACSVASPNMESNLIFLTTLGDPISALYKTIHHIYSPQLSAARSGPSNTPLKLDPSLMQTLVDMDLTLSRSMALMHNEPVSASSDPFRSILTLPDEVNFWNHVASQQGSKQAALASSFASSLASIAPRYTSLMDASVLVSKRALAASVAGQSSEVDINILPSEDEVLALIQDTQDTLLSLWKSGYPLIPAPASAPGREQFMFNVGSRESAFRRLLLLLLGAVEGAVKARVRAVGMWWKCPLHTYQQAVYTATNIIAAARGLAQTFAQQTQSSSHNAAAHKSLASLASLHPLAALDRRLQATLQLRTVVQSLHGYARAAGQATASSMCGVELKEVFAPFAYMDVLHVTLEEQVPVVGTVRGNGHSNAHATNSTAFTAGAGGFLPSGTSLWALAIAEMDLALAPVERALAARVCDKVAQAVTQPAMLLNVCVNNASLLSRPLVRDHLAKDRQRVLSGLLAYVDARQAEVAAAEKGDNVGGGWALHAGEDGIGAQVTGLVWAAQMTGKLQQVAIVGGVLGGGSGSGAGDGVDANDACVKLHSYVKSLLERVLNIQNQLFNHWQQQALVAVRNTNNPLISSGGTATGQLMTLDNSQGGALRVFFDEKLVSMVKQVRQLIELGYGPRIHAIIKQLVSACQIAYKYSLRIKQAANFYNAFHHELNPSQLGMLLADARAFEAKIRENTHIDWSNNDRANGYIDELMAMMRRLEEHNNALKAVHMQLSGLVCELLRMDMYQQHTLFCSRIRNIVSLIDNVAQHTRAALTSVSTSNSLRGDSNAPVYALEALAMWRRHWHVQVFKAVCVRYQCLLHAAVDHVEPIQCELVVDMAALQRARTTSNTETTNTDTPAASNSNSSSTSTSTAAPETSSSTSTPRVQPPQGLSPEQVLTFSPPLPLLRSQLYSSVQRIVSLPLSLPPVSSNEEFGYKGVPGGNAGAGMGTSLFGVLPTIYHKLVCGVYEEVGLFASDLTIIAHQQRHWLRILWLNDADINALIDETHMSSDEWSQAFAALVVLYREANSIPISCMLGCFSIDMAAFKRQVLQHLESYYAALIVKLKATLLSMSKAMDEYLSSALSFLAVMPSSLEAMAQSRKRWQQLCHEKHAQAATLASIEELEQVLQEKLSVKLYDTISGPNTTRKTQHVASLGLFSVAALKSKWEEYDVALNSYNSLLENEREALKGHVEADMRKTEAEVDKFLSRWQALKPQLPEDKSRVSPTLMQDTISALQGWDDEYTHLRAQCVKVADACALFDVEVSSEHVVKLDGVYEKEIQAASKLWQVYLEYQLDIGKCTLQKWIEFRPQINTFEDVLKTWQRKLRQNRAGAISELINSEIKQYLTIFPILKKITGESFQQEHWRALFHKLDMTRATAVVEDESSTATNIVTGPGITSAATPSTTTSTTTATTATTASSRAALSLPQLTTVPLSLATVTLHDFLLSASALQTHTKWVSDLCSRAQGEALIREAVDELKTWASTAQFSLVTHTCTKLGSNVTGGHFVNTVALIRDWKSLFNDINDKLSLLSSLKDSPFYSSYEDVCVQFESRLNCVIASLTSLQSVQRQWLYLEPIFQRGALPQHYALFASIHADFVAIAKYIEADNTVMALSHYANIEFVTSGMISQLEKCHKVLSVFLSEKRDAFARFYFISDDDLLEILGQSDNTSIINSHVKKLFSGVHSVVFNSDPCYTQVPVDPSAPTYIVGFRSKMRETVFLRTPVLVTGQIEQWLQCFTKSMQETLQHSLAHALSTHKPLYASVTTATSPSVCVSPAMHSLAPAAVSVLVYPSQTLCLAHSILFSNLVEQAIASNTLPNAVAMLQTLLDQLTTLDFVATAQAVLSWIASQDLFASTSTSTSVSGADSDNTFMRQWIGCAASDIEAVLENRVKNLIMDLIHCIDVVNTLVSSKITSTQAWTWQKELRTYVVTSNTVENVDVATLLNNTSPSVLLREQAAAAKTDVSSFLAQMQRARVQAMACPSTSAFRCVLRMANAQFDYTYEYQGNEGKLVYTPLTEKCYTVLTQAMHLGYGGSPYGPAGTGKTESVKALGALLGRQVLVFNCDEGLDFLAMNRIFIGIVKSGAWGCFDEFNRLKQDQLSTISQQIQTIQNGLKRNLNDITLLGQTISVNRNSALFITMNPASKEYGGRSQLPHNLKELFRAVAMSVPDNALIGKVILQSEGFRHCTTLGPRLIQLYGLCRESLSQQVHYDWGLRSLKIILRHAGAVIQGEKQRLRRAHAAGTGTGNSSSGSEGGNGAVAQLSFAEEAAILVSVLNSNTLSKLTYADSVRFTKLVETVFPGVKPHQQDHSELLACVRKVLAARNLAAIDRQLHKIVQLYESLSQRMGVVLVGPSGSGKSTLLSVLHEAMCMQGWEMRRYLMNPKAVGRDVLLGRMDADTHEWFDGILSMSSRRAMGLISGEQEGDKKDDHNDNNADSVNESENTSTTTSATSTSTSTPASGRGTRSWIVCDGDVDPEWIEALNSVLDDNKLLTMPNGARVKFDDSVNFVFETHSLKYASPATISRMNIIFISDEDLDLDAVLDSWLASQPADTTPLLRSHLPALAACVRHVFELMDTEDALVLTTTKIGLVKATLACVSGCTGKQRFALHLARGLTSNLRPHLRAKVYTHVLEHCGVRVPAQQGNYLAGKVSGSDTWDPRMYQYMVLPSAAAATHAVAQIGGHGLGVDGEWRCYSITAPPTPQRIAQHRQAVLDGVETADPSLHLDFDPYRPHVVLTPSMQAYADTLRMWMCEDTVKAMTLPLPALQNTSKTRKATHAPIQWPAVLLMGDSGCGKTMLLNHVLSSEVNIITTTIACTPATTAAQLLGKLQEMCVVATDAGVGKVLRPRDGRSRAVLVVKHVDIIQPDKYGTVEAVAFLQQLVTMRGYYEPGTLDWVSLASVQVVCVMNGEGPRRYPLTTRLTANMHILHMSSPSAAELTAVLHHHLSYTFATAPQWLYADVDGLSLAQTPSPHIDAYAEAYPALSTLTPHAQRPVLITSGLCRERQHPLSLQYTTEPQSIAWVEGAALQQLATSLTDVYTSVKKALRVQMHTYPEYTITPRDLARVVASLPTHTTTLKSLPHVLANAITLLYGSRLHSTPVQHPLLGWRTGTPAADDMRVFTELLHQRLTTALKAPMQPSLTTFYTALHTSLDLVPELVTETLPISLTGKPTTVDLEAVSQRRALLHANDYYDIFTNAVDLYRRDCEPVSVPVCLETMRVFNVIEQILSSHAGHIALVGPSGMHKRDLVGIAAHVLKMTVFTPATTLTTTTDRRESEADDGDYKAFRTELREHVRAAIISKSRCVVMLEEPQLGNIHIMNVVNAILAGTDVLPLLFSPNEVDGILNAARSDFQTSQSGLSSMGTLSEYVQYTLASYIRVAILINPLHSVCAPILALPSVTAGCTLVRWSDWAPQAYLTLAFELLRPALDVVNSELVTKAHGLLKKHNATAATAHTLPPQQQQQLASITKRDGYHLLSLCYAVHVTRAKRGFGATPASFRVLLRLFAGLFRGKRQAMLQRRDKLQQGLAKLREAASSVGKLQTQAQEQQVLVSAKQREADAALQNITTHMAVVVERQNEVSRLKAHLQVEEGKLQERRAVVERELDEILPMVRAAQEAVGTIQKDHLNEIRAYKTPPAAISHVLGAVLTMLGVQDLTWSNMRKFLGDMGIKDKIISFDATTIDKSVRARVATLLRQHADSFEAQKIRSVSIAAAPLAEWVKAQVRFSSILEQVEPKQEELRQADRLLDEARAKMQNCEVELAAVEGQVSECKRTFGETTSEAERLKIGLSKITETLRSAESLLGKLSGELDRWDAQTREYNGLLMSLPYECLLAAGAAALLAGEDEGVRASFVSLWRSMCGLKQVDVMRVLTSARQTSRWKGMGLGDDALALMNCAIVANTYRHTRGGGEEEQANTLAGVGGHVCVLVDPNRVCERWLRECIDEPDADTEDAQALAAQLAKHDGDEANTHADATSSASTSASTTTSGVGSNRGGAKGGKARDGKADVVFCSLHGDRMLSTLELAVRFGKTLVLTDVDRIPAVLLPLLRQRVGYQSGNNNRLCVRIGEKTVDYHIGFRLILLASDRITTNTKHVPVPSSMSLADTPTVAAQNTVSSHLTLLAELPIEVTSCLTVVNYSVTEAGLYDSILSVTVHHQCPQLEQRQQQLRIVQEQCRTDLAVFESELLLLLSESKTSILENTALVAKLDSIQSQALTITRTLADGERVQATIQSQRACYAGIATVATRLYLSLSQLSAVNHMYQYSLGAYMHLYTHTLDDYQRKHGTTSTSTSASAEGDLPALDQAAVAAAVSWMSMELRQRVYRLVSTTTFARDRVAICLLLLRALRPDIATEQEWAALAGAPVVAVGAAADTAPVPTWVPVDRVSAFRSLLNALPYLRQLLRLEEQSQWAVWLTSPAPEQNFPLAVTNTQCSAVVPSTATTQPTTTSLAHVLLLVQALVPHMLPAAIEHITTTQLALDSLAVPLPALSTLVADSCVFGAAPQPILFVTAAGADVSADITMFASQSDRQALAQSVLVRADTTHTSTTHAKEEEQKTTDNTSTSATSTPVATLTPSQRQQLDSAAPGPISLVEIALGSGQTDIALAAVTRGAHDGSWVLLKNLHLVTHWLPVLDKHISAIAHPHPLFRLWLTTEETNAFPSSLIARATRCAYEQPPGIRNTVLRVLAGWGAAEADADANTNTKANTSSNTNTSPATSGKTASVGSSSDYFSLGSVPRAQLLFLLAVFHAIVVERRFFVPQGWTQPYEFSPSDLRATADTIDQLFADMPLAHSKLAQMLAGGQAAAGVSVGDMVLQCQRHVAPAAVQWDTLWGLMRSCFYGGRLDGDNDIRILHLLLRKYLAHDVITGDNPTNTPVLAPTQASAATNGTAGPLRRVLLGMTLPHTTNIADYVALAQKLPQASATFAELPANASLEAERARASHATATLQHVTTLSAESEADVRARLQGVVSLWRATTQRLGLDGSAPAAVHSILPSLTRAAAEWSAMEAFIALEASSLQVLITRIHNDVTALAAVAAGESSASGALAAVSAALQRGAVPSPWLAGANVGKWCPATPTQLLEQLLRKTQYVSSVIHTLNKHYARNSDVSTALSAWLTEPLSLSQVLRPAALLNALKQYCTAYARVPIDAVKLIAAFDPLLLPSSAPRMCLQHTYITGCDIVPLTQGNNDLVSSMTSAAAGGMFALFDASADSPSYTAVPPLYLTYVPLQQPDVYPFEGARAQQYLVRGQPLTAVAVNVYTNREREECVAVVKLPCAAKPAKCVLSGAALVIDVD